VAMMMENRKRGPSYGRLVKEKRRLDWFSESFCSLETFPLLALELEFVFTEPDLDHETNETLPFPPSLQWHETKELCC
jgi:hypothetical protein